MLSNCPLCEGAAAPPVSGQAGQLAGIAQSHRASCRQAALWHRTACMDGCLAATRAGRACLFAASTPVGCAVALHNKKQTTKKSESESAVALRGALVRAFTFQRDALLHSPSPAAACSMGTSWHRADVLHSAAAFCPRPIVAHGCRARRKLLSACAAREIPRLPLTHEPERSLCLQAGLPQQSGARMHCTACCTPDSASRRPVLPVRASLCRWWRTASAARAHG